MSSTKCGGRDDSKKKVLKKLRRKQVLFLSQEPDANVSFIEGPSHHVFIGNGGVLNAISGDVLSELFTIVNEKNHSTIKQLYMPLGKDYTFASFASVEYAVDLVETLNGVCIQSIFKQRRALHRLCPSLSKGPPLHLYMCFVDRIPPLICPDAKEQDLVHSTMDLPPGLILVPDFISQQEESNFLKIFTFSSKRRVDENIALELDEDTKCKCHHDPPSSFHKEVNSDSPESALKHRMVKHYGYEFLYGTSNVNPDDPLPGGLPEICMPVLRRMLESALICEMPDQLTVNQYVPGAGIPAHVDTHSAFEDGIISISLGSQVVMDFRHPGAGTKVSVLLARRSLLIMTGQSRYLWTHSIPARKTDTIYPQMPGYPHQHRTHGSQMNSFSDLFPTVQPRGTRLSLTFRKVRRMPCNCEYPLQCDSQQSATVNCPAAMNCSASVK